MSDINEQLLKQATEILGSINKGLQASAGFAMEQLPDIAYQFILFERVYLTLMIVLSIALIVTGLKSGLIFVRETAKPYDEANPAILFSTCIFSLLSTVIGTITFSYQIKALIAVWFAPKVFLLTQLVSLVKG